MARGRDGSTGSSGSRRWVTSLLRHTTGSAPTPPRRCWAGSRRRSRSGTPPPTRCVLLAHADPATELVVLHGADDSVVPISNSRGLAAAHPRVRLETLDCGHYEVIDPLSLAWPAVRDALVGDRDD